jgi:hypothetical protein
MSYLNLVDFITVSHEGKEYEVERRVIHGQQTLYFEDKSLPDLTKNWKEDEKGAAYNKAKLVAKDLIIKSNC